MGKWPLEHWNIFYQFKEYHDRVLNVKEDFTSSYAIVKNSDGDEENVKDRKNNEKNVERVPHLLGGQNQNTENIAQNTNTASTALQVWKYDLNKIFRQHDGWVSILWGNRIRIFSMEDFMVGERAREPNMFSI